LNLNLIYLAIYFLSQRDDDLFEINIDLSLSKNASFLSVFH